MFRERDDAGVGLIAEILGNHWFNREQQSVASRDRTLLQRASEALADFSLWVSGRLRVRADRLRDDEFYDRALLAVDAIVGEQEPFSSIRIFDPKRKMFVFGPTHGDIWVKNAHVAGQKATIEYEISDDTTAPARSAAEYVYRNGSVAIVDSSRPPQWPQRTFRDIFKKSAYVPVFLGGDYARMIAIIDVRSDDSSPFLPSIAHVLTDVAALLGLTLALVDRARKLFDTNNIFLKQQND